VKKRIEFKRIEIKGKIKSHGKGKPAVWKSSYRGIPLGDVVSGIKVIELNSTYSVREGVAPTASLVEGATRVPVIEGGTR
jgi:hypothetical protein